MPLFDSILLTGAGGMLAHALKSELTSRGRRVVALDREALDVTDGAAALDAVQRHRPTLVLNAAAYTKVDLCETAPDLADRVNGHAPGHLAAAAARVGAKLVHFSTDFVFGTELRRPLRPDDPTNPLSAYGRSKLLGERKIAAEQGLDWLTIRTAWLYGPGGPSFPQTMLSLARQGVPLRVVADQVGAPTFTCDLAAATLDLLERGASGLWHVTNAGQTTWLDFTRAILQTFDVPGEVTPITSAEWKKSRPASATRPAYSVLDLTPFERTVARPMRPWQQALVDYRRLIS